MSDSEEELPAAPALLVTGAIVFGSASPAEGAKEPSIPAHPGKKL